MLFTPPSLLPARLTFELGHVITVRHAVHVEGAVTFPELIRTNRPRCGHWPVVPGDSRSTTPLPASVRTATSAILGTTRQGCRPQPGVRRELPELRHDQSTLPLGLHE